MMLSNHLVQRRKTARRKDSTNLETELLSTSIDRSSLPHSRRASDQNCIAQAALFLNIGLTIFKVKAVQRVCRIIQKKRSFKVLSIHVVFMPALTKRSYMCYLKSYPHLDALCPPFPLSDFVFLPNQLFFSILLTNYKRKEENTK